MSQADNRNDGSRWGRPELTTIALIATTTVAVTWYQSDLTGMELLTNVSAAGIVAVASSVIGLVVIRKWDPFWADL